MKRGFSLLETTVAVAILTVSIVGPLTLASSTIKSASQSKNNLISANLAQEGIELMRSVRANNVLGGNDWLSGMDSCLLSAGCVIDATNLAISACGSSCPPLKLDPVPSLYSYTDGTDTIFGRKINITIINGNEVKVSAVVSWQERFGSQQFSVEESMLNW